MMAPRHLLNESGRARLVASTAAAVDTLRAWQIWIAQGDRPYPCRYVITSTKVKGSPQYTIDVRDWKTGAEAASDNFSLATPQDAKEVKPGDVADELPDIFKVKKGAQ